MTNTDVFISYLMLAVMSSYLRTCWVAGRQWQLPFCLPTSVMESRTRGQGLGEMSSGILEAKDMSARTTSALANIGQLLNPNSTRRICCGFAVQQAVQQIHNKSV